MDRPISALAYYRDWLRLRKSVSLDEAAQVLRVSKRTLYYRIREGRLRTMRVGSSQRVLVPSLLGELSAHRPFPTSSPATCPPGNSSAQEVQRN